MGTTRRRRGMDARFSPRPVSEAHAHNHTIPMNGSQPYDWNFARHLSRRCFRDPGPPHRRVNPIVPIRLSQPHKSSFFRVSPTPKKRGQDRMAAKSSRSYGGINLNMIFCKPFFIVLYTKYGLLQTIHFWMLCCKTPTLE
jgi:hypothetical protein